MLNTCQRPLLLPGKADGVHGSAAHIGFNDEHTIGQSALNVIAFSERAPYGGDAQRIFADEASSQLEKMFC